MDSDKQSSGIIIKKSFFNFQVKTTKMERNNGITRYSCRKKLQEKFDECDIQISASDSERNQSVFSSIKLEDTRKALRQGVERISKTFTYVKTAVDAFSQRFKVSTKRRRILDETCVTPSCATPQTLSRIILGRTPTKLYSPFSFESPYNSTTVKNEKAIDIK